MNAIILNPQDQLFQGFNLDNTNTILDLNDIPESIATTVLVGGLYNSLLLLYYVCLNDGFPSKYREVKKVT